MEEEHNTTEAEEEAFKKAQASMFTTYVTVMDTVESEVVRKFREKMFWQVVYYTATSIVLYEIASGLVDNRSLWLILPCMTINIVIHAWITTAVKYEPFYLQIVKTFLDNNEDMAEIFVKKDETIINDKEEDVFGYQDKDGE